MLLGGYIGWGIEGILGAGSDAVVFDGVVCEGWLKDDLLDGRGACWGDVASSCEDCFPLFLLSCYSSISSVIRY